ncbi:uncharacterized protein LOC116170280 [Photinus pyralis]|uniref:uncharacterized protein LOC116170280 n=1 Tax=Photinus pyralis TaxID=7054 RepID=UPI001266FFC1|nr:uncharacterized protein LOC116170280 [Photinus pyralis]
MGYPVDQWSFILAQMLFKRLDINLVTRFETQHGSTEMPSFNELMNFLKKQCVAYESITVSTRTNKVKSVNDSNVNNFQSRPNKTTFCYNTVTNKRPCFFCKTEEHLIYRCPVFQNKTPKERYYLCKQNKLCVNCLSNHPFKYCKSTSSCKYCNRKHHSLLHDNNFNTQSPPSDRKPLETAHISSPTITNEEQPSAEVLSLCSILRLPQPKVAQNTSVVLSTAIVNVKDKFNNFHNIRVLIDSGSQSNLLTAKCCKRLGLHATKVCFSLKGVGSNALKVLGRTQILFFPHFTKDVSFHAEVLVVENITNSLPSCTIDHDAMPFLTDLPLADEQFYIPREIDGIIGSEIFGQIIGSNKISESGCTALETSLGYILVGTAPVVQPLQYAQTFCVFENTPSETMIKRFFELEDINFGNPLSSEEEKCENIYHKLTYRSESGRYVVSLPFKHYPCEPTFVNSKIPALRRFFSLEKRLMNNIELKKQYCNFMRDYLNNNFMELAATKNDNAFFLPHHCVLKPQSTTTKIRVVFDASTKDSNNISLNDTLLIGSKLQKDISK